MKFDFVEFEKTFIDTFNSSLTIFKVRKGLFSIYFGKIAVYYSKV